MSTGDAAPPDSGRAVTRSEEELRVETHRTEAGRVRARKVHDTFHVDQVVPRDVEHAEMERVDAEPTDSGEVETLPDGSISIPVFEERIIVEKRLVVRERVILRKHRTTEDHRVEVDLRRERLEIDTDDEVTDRVTDG